MKPWQVEFNDSYAVPAELAEHQAFMDVSWHNDMCPSFGRRDSRGEFDEDVQIMVEHPDKALREFPDGPRYFVNSASARDGMGDTIYEGDDLAEAIRVALAAGKAVAS